MPHPTYELHPLGGGGLVAPSVSCRRIGPWNLPSKRFRATVVLVEWTCVDVPRVTTVLWSDRHIHEQLETLAGRRIRSVDILERTPCPAEVLPLLDDDRRSETVEVDLVLDDELPPAFTPYRLFPQKAGELAFEAILEKLLESQPVRVSGVHEAEHWWAFGRYQIGSCGFAVARQDGAVTDFGSLFTWDTWVWAHERGLLVAEPLDFVIEAVTDLEAAAALLTELGLADGDGGRARLAAPPIVHRAAFDWRWIDVLRHRASAAFRWNTQRSVAER